MRITNEGASMGLRGKFSGRVDGSGISETTEDTEVVIGWGFSMEDLKRRFIMQKSSRETIDGIGSGKDTFTPKFEWKMGLKSKGASGFKKVPMFAFNNAILLGGVDT
ncbi:hypothetical protein EV2_024675 [Malus domestica]